MLKVPVLAPIIETPAVWPWYGGHSRMFAEDWIIIAELPVAYFPWSFAWCSPHGKLANQNFQNIH
jgi:hypothetical protein